MTPSRVMAAGAALVPLLFVSSCSSSDLAPAADPEVPSTSAASSAPTSDDPADLAEAQAIALIPTYIGTIDDLYEDPARPLEDVYAVAVAPEATTEAGAIQSFRAQGYTQLGRSEVVSTSAVSVDLSTDPSATPAPVLPTVVVSVCVDVSEVQAVDASGTSVVAPDRPRYLVGDLTVVNIAYPDPASWRVSEAPNRQAQSCDG